MSPSEGGVADSQARRARLEALAQLYWKPVYAHFRFRWRQTPEQAEDLTQDFFLWILEGPFLKRAKPGHGRFRNFVKAHLDNFIRNRLRAGRRLRRGGNKRIVSIDVGTRPEAFLADRSGIPVDEVLDRQWRQTVLENALERLRLSLAEEGRPLVYEVLKRYDLAGSEAERPTYADLARQLGIAPTDVHNYLTKARAQLYQEVQNIVAESVDSHDALKEELEFLFERPRARV